MPDFWSHHLAAQRAKDEHEHRWHPSMDVYYYFGAQGPDFFYYINKLRPFAKMHYSDFGNRVHEEKIQEVACELISRVQHEAIHGDAWRAYLAGYLTHYCIDVACHPLVCKWGPTPDAHKHVELYLDALTILDYTGKDIRAQKPSYFMPNIVVAETVGRTIAPLWYQIIESQFSESLSKSDLSRAAFDMRQIQKLLLSGWVDLVPFKSFFSKRFNYNLNNFTYPRIRTLDRSTDYDYVAFKTAFENGIARASEALQQLYRVYDGELSSKAFVSEYFKFDYLGEVYHRADITSSATSGAESDARSDARSDAASDRDGSCASGTASN